MLYYSNRVNVLVIAFYPSLTMDIGPTVQRALSDHSWAALLDPGSQFSVLLCAQWMLPEHDQGGWRPKGPCVQCPYPVTHQLP